MIEIKEKKGKDDEEENYGDIMELKGDTIESIEKYS